MSIADKLVTIADNEQKVYNAGFKFGKGEGFLDGYDEGFPEGKEEGQKAQYDYFWNNFQYNDTAVHYTHRFYRWTNNNCFDPKYNFKHSTIASDSPAYTFAYMMNISDLKKDNIFSDVSELSYTCYQSAALKNARTFHVTAKTKYSYAFNGCTALEEIRFSGTIGQNGLSFSSCTKLSKESHISTIEHLSDTTSGLKVTFSKVAVNKAFETSAGAADGSTSTEWTTLVASKSNWTIALG